MPRADGNGRVLATELLVNTPAVGACIRDGKTFMLGGIMQTGKQVGMITMDDSLKDLALRGIIHPEEAIARAIDPETLSADLKAAAKGRK